MQQCTHLANDTRIMRTLVDLTTTMSKTKRLTIRELRNSERAEKCRSQCRTRSCGERSVQKEQCVHFFRGLHTFRFGPPTDLKLATCAAISEGTPRVPLLVVMSFLLLATLARLSGVPGILCSRFPPTAGISGVWSTMTYCTAGNIAEEQILANWRFVKESPT